MALGSALMIAGMTALALAIVLSLVLVTHFLFGPAAAWTAGGLSFGAFAVIWYALPVERAAQNRNPDREPAEGDDGLTSRASRLQEAAAERR